MRVNWKWFAGFVFLLFLSGRFCLAQGGGPERVMTCQILDNPDKPVYHARMSYTGDADVGQYGDTGLWELDSAWYFAHLMDIGYGDMDLNLLFDLILWTDSTGLQLPNQLMILALDAGWTWRSEPDLGFQVRMAPGLYSDLEEVDSSAFSVPFSFSIVRSFNPSLSGIMGVEVRPGFERVLFPLIGMEWEVGDVFRLKARLPESRATLYINNIWSVYAGLEWRSTTYAMRDKSQYDREDVTIEDWRANLGLAYRVTDEIQVIGELGQTLSRDVEFGSGVPGLDDKVDIDDAKFARVGIVGPF